MTDLEKINEGLNTIDGFMPDSFDKQLPQIREAATRMSERIGELDNFVEALKIAVDVKDILITTLKSELASAKPVTCGECSNKYCCPRKITFANDGFEVARLTSCSRAVRKEPK